MFSADLFIGDFQMAAKTAPVVHNVALVDVSVISESTAAAARASGAALYDANSAIDSFIALLQPYMKTETFAGDYPRFEALRVEWCIGYQSAKTGKPVAQSDISDATRTTWSRWLTLAKQSGSTEAAPVLLGEKPRAANAEAERKATTRAAEAAQIQTVAAGKSLVELATLAQRAKVDAAKAEAAAIKAKDETKAKAAKEAADKKAAEAALLAKAAEAMKAEAEKRAQAANKELAAKLLAELRALVSAAKESPKAMKDAIASLKANGIKPKESK